MKKLLDIARRQLPSGKIHGLGATGFLLALGLLGYYEWAGDAASAEKVLVVLLALLAPAPFHSRNDEPRDATSEEPEEPTS